MLLVYGSIFVELVYTILCGNILIVCCFGQQTFQLLAWVTLAALHSLLYYVQIYASFGEIYIEDIPFKLLYAEKEECFLSCINITKECYQIGFFEGTFSLSTFVFQKTYLATFLAFVPQPCNQGTLQGQMHKIKERTRN